MPDTVKISANLAPEVVEELKRLAAKKGISVTEFLRRAIATEKFIEEETEKGSRVLIADSQSNLREVVFR